MTDRELSVALIQAGLLGKEHVQYAATQRTPDKRIAAVYVELGWVTAEDIMRIDPQAFQPAAQQAAPTLAAPAHAAPPAAQQAYPPAQQAYPPVQQQYPPVQQQYPPVQQGFPPAQHGFPPPQHGYPPQNYPQGGGYRQEMYTEYKLPGEALTYALVGLICFGIILEPIAIFKAIKALGEIKANPSLPDKGKAIAALCIGIGVFVINFIWLAFVLTARS